MNRKRVLIVLSGLLLASSSAAHGRSWQVCHLQIQVIKHLPIASSDRELQAKVLHVQAAPAVSECPVAGTVISFAPKTSDFQNWLPYKRWPKVGQRVKMRYQYLYGMCKNDSKGSKPCRIEHYSIP